MEGHALVADVDSVTTVKATGAVSDLIGDSEASEARDASPTMSFPEAMSTKVATSKDRTRSISWSLLFTLSRCSSESSDPSATRISNSSISRSFFFTAFKEGPEDDDEGDVDDEEGDMLVEEIVGEREPEDERDADGLEEEIDVVFLRVLDTEVLD